MNTQRTITPEFRSTGFVVPIRSTWRDPVGPLLTDRRIAYWERQGYYGADTKRRALRAADEKARRILARVNAEKREAKFEARVRREYI